MRRIMILALLALALPTAALANVIVYDTGTFTRGTVARNSLGGLSNFLSTVALGSGDEVTLSSPTLTPPFPGGCGAQTGTCTFATGTVTVTTANLSTNLFKATLEDGKITKMPGEAIITAEIVPGSGTVSSPSCMPLCTAPNGGFVNYDAFFSAPPAAINQFLMAPSRGVVTVVPEPGTLCLLGTSLIGLAGMVRRRFKLGR